MSSTRYRVIPCHFAGCDLTKHFEIQKRHWLWGWRYVTFADDLNQAELKIKHLRQESKYYGGNRI